MLQGKVKIVFADIEDSCHFKKCYLTDIENTVIDQMPPSSACKCIFILYFIWYVYFIYFYSILWIIRNK